MRALERFHELSEARPHLRLYALVDGLLYEQTHGDRLVSAGGRIALLSGTPDEALAYAGPWLIDCEGEASLLEVLAASEAEVPYVSWLMSEAGHEGLAQLLQLRMDVQVPGGATALLRFYDPRVLKRLALTLGPQQREDFFGHIIEWHFMSEGQPYRIGRGDA